MQIELKKSKHRIINIVCFSIIISTMIFVIPGDKTPLEIQVVVIIQLTVWLLSMIGFWLCGDKNVDYLSFVITLTMTITAIFFMVGYQSELTIYSNDCDDISSLLFDEGVNITRDTCINYAIENPNTTGMELVNHFKQNVKEKEIIISVLERQLEP